MGIRVQRSILVHDLLAIEMKFLFLKLKILLKLTLRLCLYGENSLGYPMLSSKPRYRHPIQSNVILILRLYEYCK